MANVSSSHALFILRQAALQFHLYPGVLDLTTMYSWVSP